MYAVYISKYLLVVFTLTHKGRRMVNSQNNYCMLIKDIYRIYNIYTYKCKPYGVAMRRISIFIREDQKKLLGQVARNKKTSYSALIREAIDAKLLTDFGKISKNEMIDKTFGILKNRFTDEAASEEMVDGLRSQWEQRNGRYKK